MKFVKNTYGRTTHKGLQIVGKREAGTVDIGFNQEIEKFQQQHKLMKQFLVDLREYVKAFRTISTSSTSLNKAMEFFYDPTSPMYPTWKKAHDDGLLMDQYRQKMDENLDLEVVAPLNARLAIYKVVKKRIAERNTRLLDWDRAKAELKNLSQNPSTKPERLQDQQRRTAVHKHGYEVLEEELLRDLQILHQDRLTFFDPILAVIIRMQAGYYTEGARLTNDLVAMVRSIDAHAPITAPITPNDRTTANPKNIPPFHEEAYQSSPPSSSYDSHSAPSSAGGGYSLQPPSGGYGGQPQGPPSPRGYPPQQPPQSGGYPPQQPQHYQPPPQQSGYHAPPQSGGYPPQQGGYHAPQQGGYPPQHHQQPPQQHRSVPAVPPMPSRPASHAPQARGLYAFTAGGPAELTFNVGDILTIHKQEGEWWTAELGGRQGLIPFNYVQLL